MGLTAHRDRKPSMRHACSSLGVTCGQSRLCRQSDASSLRSLARSQHCRSGVDSAHIATRQCPTLSARTSRLTSAHKRPARHACYLPLARPRAVSVCGLAGTCFDPKITLTLSTPGPADFAWESICRGMWLFKSGRLSSGPKNLPRSTSDTYRSLPE